MAVMTFIDDERPGDRRKPEGNGYYQPRSPVMLTRIHNWLVEFVSDVWRGVQKVVSRQNRRLGCQTKRRIVDAGITETCTSLISEIGPTIRHLSSYATTNLDFSHEETDASRFRPSGQFAAVIRFALVFAVSVLGREPVTEFITRGLYRTYSAFNYTISAEQ